MRGLYYTQWSLATDKLVELGAEKQVTIKIFPDKF